MSQTNRPAVRVESENRAQALRRHLHSQLPSFTAIPGLVGITLNGGLSRRYADHLSEIDVTLYLDAPSFQEWRSHHSPQPEGIAVLDGQLYDIKVVDLSGEYERVWDDDALWDASYAEILYDPHRSLQAMLNEKLQQRPTATRAAAFMMGCWWHYRLATDIWIHRGDAVQGHAMLNQAAVDLVKALFAPIREFIPHEKWLFHLSRSLCWVPDQWPVRIAAMLATGDLSLVSVRERQRTLDRLWHDVDKYLVECHFPGLPVHAMQQRSFEGLALLVNRGSIPLAEWTALGYGAAPNQEPFHSVVHIDEGRILLDRNRLLGLKPSDLYAWHYAVAAAVCNMLLEQSSEPDRESVA